MKLDIALAESSPLVLSALSEMFEKDGRFSILSTTSTAEAFLQTVITVPAQVAIMDWHLPTLGAEKLMHIVREQELDMRIVICTQTASSELAKRSMAAGAAGYYSHDQPTETLLSTVMDVADGKMIFPYLDIRDLRDPLQSLTKTEKALLLSLALGKSNKELASDHNISINTVKFHLRNLYEKLAVRNRTQAIAYYYSSLNSGSVQTN
ncbi:MAG: response regulator transcription factor [Granulosicoccaceae bacterium]